MRNNGFILLLIKKTFAVSAIFFILCFSFFEFSIVGTLSIVPKVNAQKQFAPCGTNGSCDQGLTCSQGICAPSGSGGGGNAGTYGNPCRTSGSNCDGGLFCDNNICLVAPNYSCVTGSTRCAYNYPCVNGLCNPSGSGGSSGGTAGNPPAGATNPATGAPAASNPAGAGAAPANNGAAGGGGGVCKNIPPAGACKIKPSAGICKNKLGNGTACTTYKDCMSAFCDTNQKPPTCADFSHYTPSPSLALAQQAAIVAGAGIAALAVLGLLPKTSSKS